jgi:hypothetical protein
LLIEAGIDLHQAWRRRNCARALHAPFCYALVTHIAPKSSSDESLLKRVRVSRYVDGSDLDRVDGKFVAAAALCNSSTL